MYRVLRTYILSAVLRFEQLHAYIHMYMLAAPAQPAIGHFLLLSLPLTGLAIFRESRHVLLLPSSFPSPRCPRHPHPSRVRRIRYVAPDTCKCANRSHGQTFWLMFYLCTSVKERVQSHVHGEDSTNWEDDGLLLLFFFSFFFFFRAACVTKAHTFSCRPHNTSTSSCIFRNIKNVPRPEHPALKKDEKMNLAGRGSLVPHV